MSPLANARAIPLGWSQHHAPVAAGGMNGRCRIYDPATATKGWDGPTESVTLTRGTPVYDDVCRIEPALTADSVVQADDAHTVREYLVQILFDAAPVRPEWVLVPYQCVNDPQLDGQVLTVGDVQLGTERFTRDLMCSHTQARP